MSGQDIFIAILSAVMLIGGLYLNFTSRKLTDSYLESHRAEATPKKNVKIQKK